MKVLPIGIIWAKGLTKDKHSFMSYPWPASSFFIDTDDDFVV